MDEPDWLAEQFEASRAHLRAVAYRCSAQRGGRRRAGVLAPSQPRRHERRPKPGRERSMSRQRPPKVGRPLFAILDPRAGGALDAQL